MEQRTVNLDLETAKQWFNKGGELKKVALQAFTEQELTPKVRIWEGIPELNGYYIDEFSKITRMDEHSVLNVNRNIALTGKHCKKMLAIAQISQLMPYYGGAITNKEWENTLITKYDITRINNNLFTGKVCNNYKFLAFHTEEQRNDFLQYNERLVKDYYMMD
jgi:hypothetical protein